jgi:Tfp pilus assembly protein PilX
MSPRNTSSRESGFALILALLALVLLTTMGLALSNSTSIELQISTNQRWAEQARFNAEAGIEYGKNLLVNQPNWTTILPQARTAVATWAPTAWGTGSTQTAHTGTLTTTRATRDFENWRCDARGYGMGYGIVFDVGGTGGLQEYQSQIGGATLNGAFTLWVRRPVMWSPRITGSQPTGTTLMDYPGRSDGTDDVVVLVSEGVAPYAGAAANAATSAFTATNRATYTIEVVLSRTGTNTIMDQSACSTRQGQAGGSSSGGNTSGCVALTTGSQIKEALAGSNDANSSNLSTGLLK